MARSADEIAASIESAGLKLFTDGYGRYTDEPDKIATSVPMLDRMLGGGFEPGLHCLTAGPSNFKTSWMLQIAYLAAMDGQKVAYITSEVSAYECQKRLVARKMQVDAMRDGSTREIPSWSTIQSEARKARESGDVDLLERIEDAAKHVPPRSLRIYDMGPEKPISTWVTDVDEDGKVNDCPFCNNSRYMVSCIREANVFFDGHIDNADYLFDKDLIIVDTVNDLRLYEFEKGSDRDYYDLRWRERTPEPRPRMEQIVETLDDFGRDNGVVVIGVFHSNRTTLTPHHPSMGDFKETSKIEYRGVSAIELVLADNMLWSNHPKSPKVPQGTEALGLFLLKSRLGMRTGQNRPLWLAADGAHGLIAPLE